MLTYLVARPKLRRVQFLGSWVLLITLVGIIGAGFGGAQQAQTLGCVGCPTADEIRRRVENLEAIKADARFASVEERLTNIEGVEKVVLGVLIAQLLLNAIGFRSRKDERGGR